MTLLRWTIFHLLRRQSPPTLRDALTARLPDTCVLFFSWLRPTRLHLARLLLAELNPRSAKPNKGGVDSQLVSSIQRQSVHHNLQPSSVVCWHGGGQDHARKCWWRHVHQLRGRCELPHAPKQIRACPKPPPAHTTRDDGQSS